MIKVKGGLPESQLIALKEKKGAGSRTGPGGGGAGGYIVDKSKKRQDVRGSFYKQTG